MSRINTFYALLIASIGILLSSGCADKKYLQHFTEPEQSCNRYIESIFEHLPPEKRLYELAEHFVIYFSGTYKPWSSPAKKLAIRIKCLDIVEDSAEVARIKRDFFKSYDPDLTTPENEAIDIIHKRADWLAAEGLHFENEKKYPFNILGIYVLMFGIPVQITDFVKQNIDEYEPKEAKTVTFPNGEKRITSRTRKDLMMFCRSSAELAREKARLKLFIPKNFKSIKDGVFLGLHLLPCPKLSKVKRNYFDLEWDHFRLLADFFIDTTKLQAVDSDFSVQIIIAIMQNDALIRADTLDLRGQLGNYLRYTPAWSLPATPEDGDYFVTSVVLDKNSHKKFEQINKFDSELPFNVFISSSRYMEYKKGVLDYFVPLTSPTPGIKTDDYTVMPLVQIPPTPAFDRRQVIITAYFNRSDPKRFTTSFSDDIVIIYDNESRIRYEVDDSFESINQVKNLVAVDTVFISHPNYYLTHSLGTELNKRGSLVVTYSVYDQQLQSHRLLAVGYHEIP
ncbi:hypothetical protein GF407_20545 [candidate division KSB1 bacterium]|nr:hypothetical protein [candidate division KSB1 bacterium]